eukprot:3232836-Karenia_brevis.AAC.1
MEDGRVQPRDHQVHNHEQPLTLKPTLPVCALGMRMFCLGAMWTGLWPYLLGLEDRYRYLGQEPLLLIQVVSMSAILRT